MDILDEMRIKFRGKFQQNFTKNILDREIGTQNRKYGSVKSSYRTSHQMFAATVPDSLEHLDFQNFDVDEDYNFEANSTCLGFSPDGRYFAIHSHCSTAISILRYRGVEGSSEKNVAKKYFQKKIKHSLRNLTQTYHYNGHKAMNSWWTDDSSTLIVQLEMQGSTEDDEEPIEPEDGPPEGPRYYIYRALQLAAEENARSPRMREESPPVLIGDGRFFIDIRDNLAQQIAERMRYNLRRHLRRPVPPVQQIDVEQGDVSPAPSLNSDTDIMDFPDNWAVYDRYQTCSRAVPWVVALDSAALMAYDGEGIKGETSRTMPVYHSVCRSARATINAEDSEDVTDEEVVADDDYGSEKTPLEESRADTDVDEIVLTSHFIHPYHIRFGDKMRHTYDSIPRYYPLPPTGKLRNLQKTCGILPRWAAKMRHLDGTNCSGLGYSPRRSYLRRIVPELKDCPELWFTEAKRIRQTEKDQRDRRIGDCTDGMIMFLAINVETGDVAELKFMKLIGKFRSHMRNRTLTVLHDNNYIERFELINGEWSGQHSYKYSKRQPYELDLFYRTGTSPGYPSKLRRSRVGNVIGDLFYLDDFNSPLQQDTMVLLRKGMPNWVANFPRLRTETPSASMPHMIDDEDHMALKLTYSGNSDRSPDVHIGAIISLKNQSLTLYPDIHEFLKVLFNHHLVDLVPRQWTYLSPNLATEQNWFRYGFIDIRKPSNMEYHNLVEVYDFLCQNMSNPKSASSTYSTEWFNDRNAIDFIGKHLYQKSGMETRYYRGDFDKGEKLEPFYHPVDPFIMIHQPGHWKVQSPVNRHLDCVIPVSARTLKLFEMNSII